MLTRTYQLACLATAATLALLSLSTMAAPEGMSESHTIPKIRRTDASGFKPHVGLMAGFLGETGSATNQDGSAMVDAGFEPLAALETTAQFQYTPGSITAPGTKANYNVSNLLLKVAYNLGTDMPFIRDSYIGAKSGAVFNTLESDTKTYFSVGGTAGFDIPLDLSSNVSLGAEGTYLGIIGDDTPDQVSLLGAMKYWF